MLSGKDDNFIKPYKKRGGGGNVLCIYGHTVVLRLPMDFISR